MEPYDQRPRPSAPPPSPYEKPSVTGKVVLAVVAVCAIALAVGVASNNSPEEGMTPLASTAGQPADDETAMGAPARGYDDPADAYSGIEPAEGEAFQNQTTQPDAGMPDTAPEVAPPAVANSPAVAVPPPVQSYGTEQECKDATSTACHATECSSGKALAECPAGEQKAWQAVVPAMDKTTVPEQVNPPLTGQ